jgi:UDP-glucose 4-epimerase
MGEKVLVTGGAGFIGSHVADMYVQRGFDVTVLDDLSSGRRENIPDGASFVHCGVNDPEARAALRDGGFSILNHHAAQMDVRVSVSDPLRDERINLGGLLNLLEGAREGGVRRVVFASSGGVVYGESDRLPHLESAPKAPVSPYGVSKLASEYYLACYALLHQLETVSLRYANVYGPRQSPHGEAGVVAIFCNRIRQGQPLTIYGSGEQTRDYVFVRDVARANLEASTRELPEGQGIDAMAFNVGTAQETSVNTLANTLLNAVDVEVPLQHLEARAGELLRSAVDHGKLTNLWGWKPEVDLASGLEQTYEWITTSS